MRIYNVLLFCFSVLMFSSCTITQQTIRTSEIEPSIHQYPCFVDLDVKTDKVEKSIVWNWSFFEPTLGNVKENLIADLLKENGGDILLEPRFTFKKDMFGARELSVAGFSASFKNFRSATDQDLKVYEICYRKRQNEFVEEFQQVGSAKDSLKVKEPRKRIVPRNCALPMGAKAFSVGYGFGGVGPACLNHYDDGCSGSSISLALDYGLCNLIKGDASISGGAYLRYGHGSADRYDCNIGCGGVRFAFHYSWTQRFETYVGNYIEGGLQDHNYEYDYDYYNRYRHGTEFYGNWGFYGGIRYNIGNVGVYFDGSWSDFSIFQFGLSYRF